MPNSIVPSLQSINKLFLSGPYGSGKTSLAIDRIFWLMAQERIRGDEILVIVPQRTLAQPYLRALRRAEVPHGPPVRITTVAGLARAAVELYWPLLADSGPFATPSREPTFLNLETSQYHMAQFVDAELEEGAFDGIRIERSRIISQVLDNLNKAALHGFTIDEAYDRLELAVPPGEQRTGRLNALSAARRISHSFRTYCLDATLVDFSLQIELFRGQVLTNEWSRTHLFRSHHHLIFDNVEEDTATAHSLVRHWLPALASALLIADDDAGYRLFLGADPQSIPELVAACDRHLQLGAADDRTPDLLALAQQIERILGRERSSGLQSQVLLPPESTPSPVESEPLSRDRASPEPTAAEGPRPTGQAIGALTLPNQLLRFYPQMIGWVLEEVQRLIEDKGFAAGQIAILAPYVNDALRFSLQTGLADLGIPSTSHRPSRALQSEPAARALLTLAALAHPHWGIRPAQADVTHALLQSISRLDPVRANLLVQIVYPARRPSIELGGFGALVSTMQERISYVTGNAYDGLREWIYAYRAEGDFTPLDQFFARLFGEILSQPEYGFHQDYDAARIANQLVESARNFRWALESHRNPGSLHRQTETESVVTDFGREYVRLVESGALGALYTPGWREAEDAVFIAPAYTFLMRNRTVAVQFWLDIGSSGWWERLYQPLTHPYVLSRRWPAHATWTDFDEFTTRQDAMRRLLLGLIRRTRHQIYLGMSEYGESGFEQTGPLLALVNRLLLAQKENPGRLGA